MSISRRNVALISAVSILLEAALTNTLAWPAAADSAAALNKAASGYSQKWSKVSVDLPVNDAPFPPGNGSDIASGQCLICHSSGMVLRQPPLTQDEWVGEINKMRNAYGAQLPPDQIEALAKYLFSINGRQP
jgi:mono/diheme cytochrome c family protein